MREILFRAKQHYTKEWLYGAVVKDGDECLITVGEPDGLYKQKMTVVEESTVGQFTGLLDKNGKKIFEGDKIKLTQGIGTMEWSKTQGRFVIWLLKSNKFVSLLSGTNYEVIGNIHDNPELLT